MKWNESGINSLEIVIYVLIVLGCLLLISGVFMGTKEVANDNNISVSEK